jgi:hypothetical protein
VVAAVLAGGVLALSGTAAALLVPPLGTTPVWSYSYYTGPGEMLSTAKRFAITAQAINRSCAKVNDLVAALDNVHTGAKVPSRVVSITKLLLKYGDKVLGVSSSCDVARILGAAATSLKIQAHDVYPNCLPTGKLLDPCARSFLMETRLDKQKRSFAPDVCHWTVSSGRSILPVAS